MTHPRKTIALNPAAAVRHIGRREFESAGRTGDFRCTLPAHESPDIRLLILFDGTEYPFERHYRFARLRKDETRSTFSNTEFSPDPPGLRVGPWPGWRGIPDFPRITLSAGDTTVPVQLTPWGDELSCRAIRGAAALDDPPAGEIVCRVADSRLRPVHADLYECVIPGARPRHVSLIPELTGTHPRLLVTQRNIPSLREKAGGSHLTHWKRINDLLDAEVLPWEITPESKVMQGPERLRGDDRALLSALAALVEPSPSRSALARDSLMGFIRETQKPGYEPLTIDTQAGETLFILSTCYDWTFAEWTERERDEIRLWIWHVADVCWAHMGYERRDYGQAHYLGCALGLIAFSLLFWEDHPRAREWTAHFRGVLDQILSMMPGDGFYPHGINLWIYEYGFLLRWVELFRVCTGDDLWQQREIWRNSSAFRGASTSPDALHGVTFGDPQYRVGGDSWCHYLIGARTLSPESQWLGGLLLDLPPEGIDFRNTPPRRRVYEFLFHDTRVRAQAPYDAVRVFGDGGQVFVRTEGERASLFTFRAGPPLGELRYCAGEPGGYGHADPANGSFLLHCKGGPGVSGPGPTYRRETSLHNTITIDGAGQIGDSAVWLPDFFPPEVLCPAAEISAEQGMVFVSAALERAYLPRLDVEVCHRALCVDPGRFIAGADTIRCRDVHTIEWNIHAPAIRSGGGGHVHPVADLGGSGVYCRLVVLHTRDAAVETGMTEFVPAYPNDGNQSMRLRLSVRGSEARFIWCLLLDETVTPPRYDPEACRIRFEPGPSLLLRNLTLMISTG